MRRIVWDDSDRVVKWTAKKLGEKTIYRSVGIGLEMDGELIAGVVFADHDGHNVLMHVASDGSRHWMTPSYLAFCFHYPFLQLKCQRITGLVRAENYDAQRFDEHLGFIREGKLRRACADGTDMIVYGMLKEECRFLTGKYHAALLDYLGLSPRTADLRLSEGAREESPEHA